MVWIISGDDITNLNGLNVVTSIEGNLNIWFTTLTNLTDLDNMTTIGGSLKIIGNDFLTSLSGLDNVTSIGGGLTIKSNNTLSTCEVQSICDYL